MQQRYGHAIRIVLITLGATLPLSVLQFGFAFMPPAIALAWQITLTIVLAALWVRWQRTAWARALPRLGRSWHVVVLAGVICLAIASAHRMLIEPSTPIILTQLGSSIEKRTALVLAATVTGPLLEEALFRGYMLSQLRRRFSATTSLVLSGVVFAMSHGDISRIVPQLVAGVVFGMLVVHTRRLWLAAVAHGLANAVGLIEQFVFTSAFPQRLGIGFPILCVVAAAVAAIELHRVLTNTRWYVPISPTVRVAPPLTWGIDASS
jgi:membrane protease YdiL (CAAX protease family)